MSIIRYTDLYWLDDIYWAHDIKQYRYSIDVLLQGKPKHPTIQNEYRKTATRRQNTRKDPKTTLLAQEIEYKKVPENRDLSKFVHSVNLLREWDSVNTFLISKDSLVTILAS